ncbi:MAG: transcription-repair coupling factor (superfamily II helicase), partial [Candidatus Azotimanducaceae bacterium]
MSDIQLGHHTIPAKIGERRHWSNLPGSSASLAIAQRIESDQAFCLIVTPDVIAAERTANELRFFLPSHQPVMLFPDWETLIYDGFSPHQDIISDRLAILNTLPEQSSGALIVPASSLMHRITPRQFALGNSLLLETGQTFDVYTMRRKLEASAYRCVDTVAEHGEFAVRGAIMDIFPMGSNLPYRIDLFDDEIDTLRTFDPETQLSIEKVDTVNLLPAREFPLTEAAIIEFKDRWHLKFSSDPRNCPLYQDVSQGMSPAGIEYYLSLFFPELESLFDYLPASPLVFTQDIERALEYQWQEAASRFENLRHDVQRPVLAPSEILMSPNEVLALCNKSKRIEL